MSRIRPVVSAREILNAIDPAKLGPDSPLHQLLTKKRRPPRQDIEHEEQVKLFTWAAGNESAHPELALLFAVPNFSGKLGRWTARHGARLKAEGRKPGVPDVWLPVARNGYHGLAIELKAGRNQPTIVQHQWLKRLAAEGWRTVIAYSASEAIGEIVTYLRRIG
jgi:hypothetical protein